MAAYLNAEAVECWLEAGRRFERPLREAIVAGQGTDCLDAWVAQMLRNSAPTPFELDAPGAIQPRRVGGRPCG